MPAERWSAVDGRRLDFKALEEARRMNLNVVFWGPFQRLMGGVFGDVVVVVVVVVRDGPKLSKSFFDVEEAFFSRRSLKTIVPFPKKQQPNKRPWLGLLGHHQGGGMDGMDGGRDLGVGLWRGVEC